MSEVVTCTYRGFAKPEGKSGKTYYDYWLVDFSDGRKDWKLRRGSVRFPEGSKLEVTVGSREVDVHSVDTTGCKFL